MKSQPKLIRILTPPPVSSGNLIAASTMKSVTQNAFTVQMTRSNPTAVSRTVPQKNLLTTVHPSQPLVAYLVVPDALDKQKAGLPMNVVVQNVKTRQVLWTMSVGELAASLFDFDILSRNIGPRQAKVVKDLGTVYAIEFFDPSTLYWSGFTDSGAEDGKSSSTSSPQLTRWQHIFIQFSSRILIVNIRTSPSQIASPRSPQQSGRNRQIMAHISQEATGAVISSNALAIAQHLILLGTVDGMLKVFDWSKGVVLATLKVCAKHDYICHICGTNRYPNYEPKSSSTPKRVVVLSKKGSAYLVELEIDGLAQTVKEILPPKARFDGGGIPTSVYKSEEDSSSLEHIFCKYDAFRNLFLWCYPSKNKAKLLVWDLGNLPEPDSRQRRKGEPTKPDPLLVMQFPYETSHTIFPGWVHENVPMDSIACVAVTKDGDFQMLVAPLYNSGSSSKYPFAAVTILSVNLGQLIQRDVQGMDELPYIKVQSIFCPALRDSSVFLVGTNIGVLMVQMKDGNLVPFPGARHAHLSANVGSMGRSLLSVKNSDVIYGALDSAHGANAINPLGSMITKNSLVVYESPPPLHLPPEIHKRPVRLPPLFLSSPSRTFLCCFWKEEMRYEILHVATMFQRVSSRTDSLSGSSPVVASGIGVASVAWIGDDDVFALLYNPEQDLALKVGIDLSAPTQSLGKEIASAASKITDIKRLRDLSKLKELASMKTVKSSASAVVGTANKLKSLEGLREIANTASKATVGTVRGTVKGATKVTVGTAKLTSKVAVGTVKGTMKGTTKVAVGTVKGATKVTVGTAKTTTKFAVGGTNRVVGSAAKVGKVAIGGFGLLGKRRSQAQQQTQESLAKSTSGHDDDQTLATAVSTKSLVAHNIGENVADGIAATELEKKNSWVELRSLVSTNANASELGGGVSAATVSNLGELSLRTGNRNPPTVVFGGPVLCVASKIDEDDEGLAYFYTRKKGQDEDRADVYVSSGPAFPCPDIVAWDDEGRLCAVAIKSQVTLYLSDEPEFVILGTARLGPASDMDLQVVSASFVHGTLFCTTRSAVYCIFLGDLDGGICHLDVFQLASSDVSAFPVPTAASVYSSLTPAILPMALSYPCVLGYQSGSLMISTVAGVQAIPLSHPILRIGALLAAGQHSRAEKWFEAIPSSDHESLACFLERRGAAEVSLMLSGLSLETTVDICMRYGCVDRLEEVVDVHGLEGLRSIDMGRGVSPNLFGLEGEGNIMSVVVAVGAYLLSYGRVELVRRLASECLGYGIIGRKDGFVLASLLLSVDGSDSKRVIRRAVQDIEESDDWMVGKFVQEHMHVDGSSHHG